MKFDQPKTRAFETALARAYEDPDEPQPLCEGKPEKYADYQSPPSERDCREMCEPCPLLAICRESAKQQRPAWGIQGGIAWKQGRQYHWLKKLGHIDESPEDGS